MAHHTEYGKPVGTVCQADLSRSTIAAIATARTPVASGAGIGVLRLSGPSCTSIALGLTGKPGFTPRHATLCPFFDATGHVLDRGLVLFFPRPASFTGEDMLELHTHGGRVLMEAVLERVCELGGCHARPGEFSERAFHNGKIDLLQAEAISDLISSTSRQAARAAMRSLQGQFSDVVRDIQRLLMQARVACEALLDFASDIETEGTAISLSTTVVDCNRRLCALIERAKAGSRLQGAVKLVIAGPVNVGKSSLMNALCHEDRSIVSGQPGTTRDVISCPITLEGFAMEAVDTAGLRDAQDEVEQEGLRRTDKAVADADVLLYVTEADGSPAAPPTTLCLPAVVFSVRNKVDRLTTAVHERKDVFGRAEIAVSAKTGQGLPLLTRCIVQALGQDEEAEDVFLARQRHIQALTHCALELKQVGYLLESGGEMVLIAEQLRLAQVQLDTITGTTVADDVLAGIFAQFCIGK